MQWLLLKKVRNGDQASNYAKLVPEIASKIPVDGYVLLDV